jgi:hypothetical protein
VITATPGPRHLLELKGLIYDEVRLHEQNGRDGRVYLRHQQQLAYPMQLNGARRSFTADDAVRVAGEAAGAGALRQQATFAARPIL